MTGEVQSQELSQPTRKFFPVEIIPFGLLIVFWSYIWRIPIWSVDDMYFATRSEVPHGQIVWSDFFRLIGYDVVERNGRTADLWGQLIFSTGDWIRVFMIALVTLFSVVFYLATVAFVRAYTGKKPGEVQRVVLSIAAVALPFTLIANDEKIAGSTFMFMSATVGYVGGATLLLALIALVIRRYPDFKFGYFEAAAILLLTVITAMHHEVIALTLLGIIVALLLTTNVRKYGASAWLTLGGVFAISLARFATPGLWGRHESIGPMFLMEGAGPTRLRVVGMIRFIAFAVQNYPTVVLMFVMGFMVLIHLAAMRLPRGKKTVAILVEAFLFVSVIILLTASHRVEVLRSIDPNDIEQNTWLYHQPVAYLVAVFALVVVILFAVPFLLPGMWKGMKPGLVILGGVVGTVLIPAVLSSIATRPLFFALTMMAFGGVSLAAIGAVEVFEDFDISTLKLPRISEPKSMFLLSGLVIALLIGPAPIGVQDLAYHVDKNIEVWADTLEQIEAAQKDPSKTVKIAPGLPYATYSSNYLGRVEGAVRYVEWYWDLDPSVNIVRGK